MVAPLESEIPVPKGWKDSVLCKSKISETRTNIIYGCTGRASLTGRCCFVASKILCTPFAIKGVEIGVRDSNSPKFVSGNFQLL